MSWGDEHRIETPEQIDVRLEIAGPGSRCVAQLLDWLIKLGVVVLVVMAFALFTSGVGRFLDRVDRLDSSQYAFLAMMIAVAFVFFFGYDVYFEGCRDGQTPGKKACGLRVVREHGGPIDVMAAFIRNIVGLVDFLPAYYVGGGLICVLNKRGQRLGDMAAATIVIRERGNVNVLNAEPGIANLAADDVQFAAENLIGCDPNDLNVLRSFFVRVPQLDPEPRRALVERLFATYSAKTKLPTVGPADSPQRKLAFLASLHRDLATLRAGG